MEVSCLNEIRTKDYDMEITVEVKHISSVCQKMFSVKAFLSATLGRFFLSGGLYWKVKYISHLQYLWEHIKKGDIEIPEFVQKHDDILEQRPLTDYGIEPDPHMLVELNSPVNLFWKG
ncbi:hypothetical protein QQ045_000239 [Rhodiola kirilowii]